ncbi:hypothetical protein EVAR_33631_1 [Eumeta japonica]|uniref:Uncharacterized protein n=1 Tax=Eumeta variegata TaxID=151549 RepID=A0A4C1WCM9_EUMVA|nr:hypothetical protein EVAR_33631_1 [Eumeta japonica]
MPFVASPPGGAALCDDEHFEFLIGKSVSMSTAAECNVHNWTLGRGQSRNGTRPLGPGARVRTRRRVERARRLICERAINRPELLTDDIGDDAVELRGQNGF